MTRLTTGRPGGRLAYPAGGTCASSPCRSPLRLRRTGLLGSFTTSTWPTELVGWVFGIHAMRTRRQDGAAVALLLRVRSGRRRGKRETSLGGYAGGGRERPASTPPTRAPEGARTAADLLKTARQERDARRRHDDGTESDGLLDYEAAAAYLCTTPRHIRELWAKRQLAAIKVGRCVRFTKEDLDAFIAANRVGAARPAPGWLR
jgi:excisionase family DNA binding protein